MRLELINRIKEDELLGKSILTNEGSVLLRAGIKLNSKYINKLKEMGVFYVYIEDDRLDDVIVEDEQLSELKQVAMKNMSDIMKNIHNYNNKGIRKTMVIMEELVNYIIDMGDVNKSLQDIKTYDNYTFLHCIDTCIMSSFIGLSHNFNEWQLKDLSMGAVLHDIGKTKVPASITKKEGKLTSEEYGEMKKHPVYGAKILRKNTIVPDNVITVVEQHHERIDGTGYPLGLQGKQISKYAQIVCICDVYDSVSNNRCYRRKFSPNDAYELILAGSGSFFDVNIVNHFKNTFSIYPLGACVKLSNGEEGYVIRQNKGFPDRPVLRVLYDVTSKNPVPFYEIDLVENTSLVIVCLV